MSNKKNEVPMAGHVEVFNFSEEKAPIRVQVINGEPWFVAKDICVALGIANHKDAVSRLDDDERQGVGITDPLGIRQTANAVSESGLYALIFQSRKPKAKKFRKWVTSEVLPSIRRTGRYEIREKRGVVRMSRGEGVRADMLDLLWLIGENLEKGDQAQIALELGVSRVAVNRTLNGLNRSSRILMALYRKAKENRERNLLYNEPGVMAERLRETGVSGGAKLPEPLEDAGRLPEIRIMTQKRGGQYGNQNARKHGRKEGK